MTSQVLSSLYTVDTVLLVRNVVVPQARDVDGSIALRMANLAFCLRNISNRFSRISEKPDRMLELLSWLSMMQRNRLAKLTEKRISPFR